MYEWVSTPSDNREGVADVGSKVTLLAYGKALNFSFTVERTNTGNICTISSSSI